MTGPWLVLILPDNHARLGSFPLCMLKEVKKRFIMNHHQTDINGTQTWIVFSDRKDNKCAKHLAVSSTSTRK